MSPRIGARRKGPSPRPRVVRVAESVPRKEDAECCLARRDDLGRLPIGYCSPECVRRRT